MNPNFREREALEQINHLREPLAVFDSGMGGLTVLKELASAYPNRDFLYYGDTARVPYGPRSEEVVHRYLQEGLSLLTSWKTQAIMIACNSASAAYLNSPIRCSRPVYDVISPSVRRAAKFQRVGVIATRATIESKIYERLLKAENPQIRTTSCKAPLLVPLVEEGWIDDPLTNLVLHRYLESLNRDQIELLILGCTHYPLLLNGFRKVLNAQTQILSSSEALSSELIRDQAMKNPPKISGQRKILVLLTDMNENYSAVVQKILNQDLQAQSLPKDQLKIMKAPV